MMFFKNLFKPKSIKLIESNLAKYSEILKLIQSSLCDTYTKDGKVIPKEIHTINILLTTNKLGFRGNKFIKRRMLYHLLKKVPDLDSEILHITLKDLLSAYLYSIFYFNHASSSSKHEVNNFLRNLNLRLRFISKQNRWDLNKKLDITFLRDKFWHILLITNGLQEESYRNLLKLSKLEEKNVNQSALANSNSPKLRLVKSVH